MKVAIYVEDGITQVILTAESAWEKATLAQIDGKELTVFRGGFYECAGGWFRQNRVYSDMWGENRSDPPDSVLLRINKTVSQPRSEPDAR